MSNVVMVARAVYSRAIPSKSAFLEEGDAGTRTMNTYYDNRAFHGAPPTIPHKVFSDNEIGGKNCLQCHKKGGFVLEFKAYAPVTSHPEWLNCNQCHLPQKTATLYQETDWEKSGFPALQQAIAGTPLTIPHSIQNRKKCISCHAGPSAPKEIRTSHPERINCEKCHLPQASDDIFEHSKNKDNGLSLQLLKENEIEEVLRFIALSTP